MIITKEKEEKLKLLTAKEKVEEMEVAELMSDVFFKAVFTRRQEVLLKMIKILLDIRERYDNPITIVGYELPPLKKKRKTNRGDILIILSDDSYVHIEVNNSSDRGILSRNIVQVSRIYANLRRQGKDDKELEKIKVDQLNFNAFKGTTNKLIEHISLCEKESGQVASEILNICNVNVVKCHDLIYNEDVRDISKAERWGAILKSKSLKEISYLIGDDLLTMKEKKDFLDTIISVNHDDKILQDWMVEENAKMKYEGEMNTARSDGRLEGLAEGMEKGIQEGMEKGIQDSKLEVIKNMLAKNIDYETISDVTGKTVEEVKEIEKNNN